MDILYSISTDSFFRIPAFNYLKARNEIGGEVYNYLFSPIIPYLGGLTAWHCAEIPYVFRNVEMEATQCCAYEYAEKLADDVSNAWISFMRNGNPSTSELIWEPYTKEKPQVMYLNENSGLTMEKDRELIVTIMQNKKH